MKKNGYFILLMVGWCLFIFPSFGISAEGDIKLTQPSLSSNVSIEKAFSERRSLRTYKNEPLTLNELSQLLWAGQGINDQAKGLRTAPSGMASYLLNLYAVALDVSGVPQGFYRYEPKKHELILISKGNRRDDIANARFSGPPPGASAEVASRMASHANPLVSAPLIFIITGDSSRGEAASYYLEAGHAAQNILLQCVSLGMGGVPMAGIDFDKLKKSLKLGDKEVGIYLIPVGKK
jgi:nitroreductase